MLGLGAATRIFVATGATDMRLGFNGLYALAAGQLQQDPQSGHLFLFANKRRDRMKILFFDGSARAAWRRDGCTGQHPKMAARS
jgi:transposase